MAFHRRTQEVQTRSRFGNNHPLREPPLRRGRSVGGRRNVMRDCARHCSRWRSPMQRPASSGYARSIRAAIYCRTLPYSDVSSKSPKLRVREPPIIHGSSLRWARPVFPGPPTPSRANRFDRPRRKRVSATCKSAVVPRSISRYSSGGVTSMPSRPEK